jgi:putative transcriptional regulator
MEQGRYVPSLALAFRIARVFKAGIEDIFEYGGEEHGEGL